MMFQDTFLNRVATLTAVVLFCLLVYALMPVLIPFLVAFVLAYLLNPVVVWLMQYKLPRWFAILLVYFMVILVLIGAMAYLIPKLWEQFILARDNMPVFINWLNHDAAPWLSKKLPITIPSFDSHAISEGIMSYFQTNYDFKDARSVIAKLATSGLSAISSVGLFVLIPVVAFFLMLNWQANVKHLRDAIPPRYLKKTLSVAQECHDVMMSFVKGQLLVMFLLGVFYALTLQWLVGLDTGLIIGLFAGLASIVPYLGLVVGVLAAVIACIVQFGFDWMVFATLTAVFIFAQVFEGYVLQPFLLGDRIGLSPVMVIFAVLVGGQLLGLVGMLIGLPLVAVIMVLLRHAYQAYKKSNFYNRAASFSLANAAANALAVDYEDEKPTALTDDAKAAVTDSAHKHASNEANEAATNPAQQPVKPELTKQELTVDNQQSKKPDNDS